MNRALLVLLVLSTSVSCDTISEVVSAFGVAKDAAVNLEADLKAPLTDARIDKVVQVTPALRDFSKEAKVKWEPNPSNHDLSNLATSLAGLSEYASFFESHGTRLTEYYVDFIKINGARSRLLFKQGQADAKAKLEKEQAELEERIAGANETEKLALQAKLKGLKLTQEKLSLTSQAGEQLRAAKGKAGYVLTDDEVKLVEARLQELGAVFEPKKVEQGEK